MAPTTYALEIKSSHGRGGGTIARPESAEVFRAGLFPRYQMYQHEENKLVPLT